MEPAVAIESLTKRYRTVTALAGIDLEIEKGQIFGLLGPNGAGKTTLIRSLVGALRPTSGRVSVLGLDPITNRWEVRQRVGYMPQAAAVYIDLSARRNVAFFAAGHRRSGDDADVERTLALVDLVDRADDPVRTLSGGMRQRVSLACALACKPELLILDEPTSGIDPELRASFWGSFREMAAGGATVVVSTHQMGEALECDRVVLLRQGEVVAVGDPRRLFRSSRARVQVWSGDSRRVVDLNDYPVQLPALLAGGSVDRVEMSLEPIEDLVLRLFRRDDTGNEGEFL